jgi:L-aspartate oxidase
MQALAGVARDETGLAQLADQLANLPASTLNARHASAGATPEAWELDNMILIARAVVELASRRRESRGAHWRKDFPSPVPQWRLRQVVTLLPGGELGVGALEVQPQGAVVPAGAAAR